MRRMLLDVSRGVDLSAVIYSHGVDVVLIEIDVGDYRSLCVAKGEIS